MSVHQITYANATFTRNGESRNGAARWACDICGRHGLGDDFLPGTWATTCARGHAPCPWCESMHPVRLDGTPRVHTSCPKVPADVEASWGRIKLDMREARDVRAKGAGR